MNKTLIIAAIAALAAGAASAQSSVTVYGRLNTTAEYIKYNGVNSKQLVNDASRIGFMGTEDLGGGLRAGFQLESGFDVSTGVADSPFWKRQSEVNLSGGFGAVRAGTFNSSAYYAVVDYVSMHNHDTGDSEDALYPFGVVSRRTNKIYYRAPSVVADLSAEVAVSAPEGAAGQVRTWDSAINYKVNALALGFGAEKNGSANLFGFRALYDFGPILLGGYVMRDKSGWAPTSNLGTRTSYRLSGAYLVGASEFHLNFGSAGSYGNVPNSSAKQYTAEYNYNLSKRTKIYTYYTKVADSAAQIYLKNNFSTVNGPLLSSTRDFSAFALGLRHNF